MKLRKSCIFKNTIFHIPENLSKTSVFFDIETTGLSWRTSHLYLIGCAYYDKNEAAVLSADTSKNEMNSPISEQEQKHPYGWILQQWFLEKPGEEKELLEQFSVFLQERIWDTLVHYNGTTFDIPYLHNKYQFYGITDPLSGIETDFPGLKDESLQNPFLQSRDLYQEIRPYKKLLHTASLKQRDLEVCFGLPRDDCFTGGELIDVYQNYLRTGDEALLDCLWLHNFEDVRNLLPVCAGVNAYRKLFGGEFQITKISFDEDPPVPAYDKAGGASVLTAVLTLSAPLPAPFCAENEHCTLRAEKSSAVLTIPVYEGELRHYFKDYKNYYYLPVEDMAIHKSVGTFVDSAHRKKATADTCYQRAAGCFLPQMQERFSPLFKMNRKDKISWVQTSIIRDNTEDTAMKAYLLDFLQAI